MGDGGSMRKRPLKGDTLDFSKHKIRRSIEKKTRVRRQGGPTRYFSDFW